MLDKYFLNISDKPQAYTDQAYFSDILYAPK